MDGSELKSRYVSGERDFQGVSFSGADLGWINLCGTDLRNADFSRANLSGADLSQVNLSDETNLAFADLSRADLCGANLKGANLQGANLAGTLLRDAIYDEKTQFPRGFDPATSGAIASGAFLQVEGIEVPSPSNHSSKPKSSSEIVRHSTSSKFEEYEDDRYQFQEEYEDVWDANEKHEDDYYQFQSKTYKHKAPALPTTTSTPRNLPLPNSSGIGTASVVPAEIKGWNWGAFLLPGLWCITNNVWIGLLSWIPYVGWIIALVLGPKGNEFAWRSRKWRDVAAFKAHQRGWAIASWIVWGIFVWVWISAQ